MAGHGDKLDKELVGNYVPTAIDITQELAVFMKL
jgi:hypothetical protein